MPECSIHRLPNIGGHFPTVTTPWTRSAPDADHYAIHGRIFHFGKAEGSSELDQITQLCDSSMLAAISDEYVAYTSDQTHPFNTIFVIGSDSVRVRRFFRIYRPMFLPKAKIAVLKDARPKSRAQLLMNGFDDVFDAGMKPLEQRARLAAIHERLALTALNGELRDARHAHLLFYVDGALTDREARILAMLVAGQGKPVRLHQLTAAARSPVKSLSHKSLQALISGLRSKLKPAFCITAFGTAGYAFARHNALDELERKLG